MNCVRLILQNTKDDLVKESRKRFATLEFADVIKGTAKFASTADAMSSFLRCWVLLESAVQAEFGEETNDMIFSATF